MLIKNLKKRTRLLEKEGKGEEAAVRDFLPITFNLLREYALFVEEFKRIGGLLRERDFSFSRSRRRLATGGPTTCIYRSALGTRAVGG